MINLNDTTPVAVSPSRNVKWQQDGSGNISANYSLIPTKTTVAPVAGVLTIDASLGGSFKINVNAAITSMSITNPTDGQEITLLWVQDVTGHAITLATNLKGATAPTVTANSVSSQKFTYDVTATNWYAVASGSTGM